MTGGGTGETGKEADKNLKEHERNRGQQEVHWAFGRTTLRGLQAPPHLNTPCLLLLCGGSSCGFLWAT